MAKGSLKTVWKCFPSPLTSLPPLPCKGNLVSGNDAHGSYMQLALQSSETSGFDQWPPVGISDVASLQNAF